MDGPIALKNSLALLMTLALAPSAWAAPDFPAMNTYVQKIEIRFKTPEAAARARLRVARLYRDASSAFSSRWDDNHWDDLKVAEVMRTWGQKGTFYLCDPAGWHDPGQAGKALKDSSGDRLPKALVAGGHSIGDHTRRHEFLSVLSKNKAFEEILALRVEREVSSQSPVVCFTYPYGDMRGEADPVGSQADLEEMLLRSGIYFLGENGTDLGATRLLSARFVQRDGITTGAVDPDKEKSRERAPEDPSRPLYLSTMHPWADAWGGPSFPRLSRFYARWSGSKNIWYCNQNQYAAYRAQAIRSRLETRVVGSTLLATLVRPEAADLGDPVPLSFLMDRVRHGDALGVQVEGARAVPFSSRGHYGFDLQHDSRRGMPKLYAKTDNPLNLQDPAQAEPIEGLPGLRVLLRREGSFLVLNIRNRGAVVVRDVRVTFRLPLQWENEPAARRLGGMAPGARREVRIELKPRDTPGGAFSYASGERYLVAQLDFYLEFPLNRRARLYATCRVPEEEPDRAYPRDGFHVLGPLPADREDFDLEEFTQGILRTENLKRSYELFGGVSVFWKTPRPGETGDFDPEIVWTTGKSALATFYTWDPALHYAHGNDLYYLLAGRVFSPRDQRTALVSSPGSVTAWSLNREVVEGSETNLRAGWNDLRVLYHPQTANGNVFSPHCYGAFLRWTDGGAERLSDIRFERRDDLETEMGLENE